MNGWLLRADTATGSFEVTVGGADQHTDGNRRAVVAADHDAGALARAFAESSHPTSPAAVAAGALWDMGDMSLQLSRDRTGLHPLFYAATGSFVVASTDLRALVSHTEVSADISPRALRAWLDGSLEPSQTLFSNIQRVPAGHSARFDRAGSGALRRDWSPPPPGTLSRSDASQFGERLEEVLRKHTTVGRPAVFLSGGLDSGSVAAAAASVTRPIALCVDFRGASEAGTQRAVAAALDMEVLWREAAVQQGTTEKALRFARRSLWPTPAVWAPIFEELATDAQAAGAGVLVDGLGGDELLDAGYAAGRALLRRPWHLPFWLRAERRYAGGIAGSLRSLVRNGPSYDGERASDIVHAGLAMQREATFDLGVQTGIPRRHPLWDAEIVELIDGLPPEALVAGGDPKSPGRAYLRERVPQITGSWPRPKVADAFATAISSQLRAHVSAEGFPRLTRLGVVSEKDVFTTLPFAKIWPMLSLESWLAGVEDWGKGR